MTIDEIYMKIGAEIFNSIEDNEWISAKLNIEYVGSGVVSYDGEYTSKNKKIDMPVEDIDSDICEWIADLHKITTEGESNKWNKAIFSLTSEGDFDMEFIWDQELHDEIEKLSKS